MTVETAPTTRQDVVDYITAVGNLVGQVTVDIQPRVAGRVEAMSVKLGDRVSKGQQIAKIEDRELLEQIRQAQANLDVNKATVVNRESDEKVAASVLARNQASYDRGLVAKQVLEDAEARHNARPRRSTSPRAQLRADDGADRRAEDHAVEHDNQLAGGRLRQPAAARSRRVCRRQHGDPRPSSTSARCG